MNKITGQFPQPRNFWEENQNPADDDQNNTKQNQYLTYTGEGAHFFVRLFHLNVKGFKDFEFILT